MIRPRSAFPTPLFRLFCGWLAGGACATAAAALVSRWNEAHSGYHAGLALAALAAGIVTLRWGTTLRRLALATGGAIGLVAAASVLEFLVFLMTYTWE